MGKLYRVLIWGKNAVGKTSLIEQLAYGRTEDKVWRKTSSWIHLIFFSHIEKRSKIHIVFNMTVVQMKKISFFVYMILAEW